VSGTDVDSDPDPHHSSRVDWSTADEPPDPSGCLSDGRVPEAAGSKTARPNRRHQMDKLRTAGGRARAQLARWRSSLRGAVSRGHPQDAGSEQGQGLAEYALILAMIAIVAIAALAFFGLQISAVLTDPVNRDFTDVLSHISP
jgi:Flp pilus assembly pilin Flp